MLQHLQPTLGPQALVLEPVLELGLGLGLGLELAQVQGQGLGPGL